MRYRLVGLVGSNPTLPAPFWQLGQLLGTLVPRIPLRSLLTEKPVNAVNGGWDDRQNGVSARSGLGFLYMIAGSLLGYSKVALYRPGYTEIETGRRAPHQSYIL